MDAPDVVLAIRCGQGRHARSHRGCRSASSLARARISCAVACRTAWPWQDRRQLLCRASTSTLEWIRSLSGWLCRRSCPISSSEAPLRSIPVASVCRSTWAAPREDRLIPARAMARRTMLPTADGDAKPRCGASTPTNSRRVVQATGRPSSKQAATAWPTSHGSGRRSRRPFMPEIATMPLVQSTSSSVNRTTSQARRPVVFGTALARISRVIWFESGRFFSRSPVLTGGGERGHCV